MKKKPTARLIVQEYCSYDIPVNPSSEGYCLLQIDQMLKPGMYTIDINIKSELQRVYWYFIEKNNPKGRPQNTIKMVQPYYEDAGMKSPQEDGHPSNIDTDELKSDDLQRHGGMHTFQFCVLPNITYEMGFCSDPNEICKKGFYLSHLCIFSETRMKTQIPVRAPEEKKIDSVGKWYQLNKLTIGNYMHLFKKYTKGVIPKIFHFIWIGDKEISPTYIKYIKTWINHHPDYAYCFWNDKNIPTLANQEQFDKAEKMAMKADILRYEILNIFGGIYVDCDFWCFKNIEEKISNLTAFSAWESEHAIAIGLMGFIPEHPFLKKVIDYIPISCQENKGNPNVSAVTGPVMFTRLWLEYVKENNDSNDLYAFTPDFCYGYTYQEHYNKLEPITRPEYYAIHMWGNSWGNDGKEAEKVDGFLGIGPKLTIECQVEDVCNGKFEDVVERTSRQIMFVRKPKKIKVCHIVGYFHTGGIERLIHYFDKYGDHLNIEYHLVYMNMGEFPYPIERMHLYPYVSHEEGNRWLNYIEPDVILDHVGIYFQEVSKFYAGIDQTKVIAMVHGAIKYTVSMASHPFINYIHLYDESNKHPYWLTPKNNHYVSLGAELQPIREINSQSGQIVISIIGRVSEEKMPIEFMRKLSSLANRRRDLSVNIYGGRNRFSISFNNDIDEIFSDTQMRYHGHITDIYSVYRKTDVLLIPSVYETGSFACIEGLTFGNVIVGRNSFGMIKLVDDESGFLCDSDDEIINILETLTTDTIAKKSIAAHKRSAQYNIVTKIGEMEQVLRSYTITLEEQV